MSLKPHGGTLIDRRVTGATRDELIAEAASLPRVDLNEWQISDLDMIAVGALSPLTGFMGEENYRRVTHTMHMMDGTAWSLPICLRVARDKAGEIKKRVALYGEDRLLAVMDVDEKYEGDKREEAQQVFRTDDEAHPGVAALYGMGDVMLGGDVWVVARPSRESFKQYRLDPAELRAKFAGMNLKTVVGFQTRNPIHRAHEYLIKCALEIVDGALIHPLVGATKKDDIPADVRMRCYEALLENYFPQDRALMAVFPAAMRYAGPREAIFHSIVRKNYGCTHFIVGRDHAGVGKYYGTYDAQLIFSEFEPGELGITPFMFEHAFWCKKTGGMATPKTSNAGPEDRFFLSGTQVREMLRNGEVIPEEFTRPEVAKILTESMRSQVSA